MDHDKLPCVKCGKPVEPVSAPAICNDCKPETKKKRIRYRQEDGLCLKKK